MSECHDRKYETANQPLRLGEFFDGELEARGEFRAPFGRVKRRFQATVTGTREGNVIRIEERFLYDDGATESREWMIEALGDERYRGRATDVVGEAIGRVENGRLRWSYPIDLAIGKRVRRVRFDDEFCLVEPNSLLNTADISKFGVRIGRVIQTFARRNVGTTA